MSVVAPVEKEDDRVVTALLELKYANTAVVGKTLPSSQKELAEQVVVTAAEHQVQVNPVPVMAEQLVQMHPIPVMLEQLIHHQVNPVPVMAEQLIQVHPVPVMMTAGGVLPDIKDKTTKASSARPIKKRSRKSVTCNYCKGAKIKCNKKLPCDQCVKRGISETCAIFNRKAPTKGFQEFYLPRLVNKKRKRLSDNDNVFKNTRKCTRSLNCTRPFSHVGICKLI